MAVRAYRLSQPVALQAVNTAFTALTILWVFYYWYSVVTKGWVSSQPEQIDLALEIQKQWDALALEHKKHLDALALEHKKHLDALALEYKEHLDARAWAEKTSEPRD
jgi:hypothetical protein